MLSLLVLPLLLQTTTTTSSSSFDSYYVYPTRGDDNEQQTFAYDAKRVCIIYKYSPSYYYVRLENAYDRFDRTAMTRLDNNANEITACLNYKGFSYLFFGGKNDSSTVIIRGVESRTFPIRLNNLHYDHLHSTLYVVTDDAFLYQINLKVLHQLWGTAAGRLKATMLVGHRKLPPTIPLNNVTDMFTFNNTLYWLTADGIVYKQGIHTNTTVVVERNYPGVKFNIIPFPKEGIKFSVSVTENPHIKISGLGTDSILLPLPSTALNDFVYTTNNIFLYILDIIFFICLIIILRIASNKTKSSSAGKSPPPPTLIKPAASSKC